MNRRMGVILATLAVATLWTIGNSLATDTMSGQPGKPTEKEMILQSSKLSDLNVYNRDDQNAKLGKVDNLIINAHTGQVLYGILDTGLGGKLIPVPWTALQLHKSASKDKYWMTLAKTQDQLANAPTFDSHHWPDFKNSPWQQSVEKFFGVRTVARPQDSGGLTANQVIFQSSQLSDLNVYNRSDTNKKLGNLDNLVIDAHTGQVRYGILDTGVGGKNIAVPWSAFQLQKAKNNKDYWLTLDKTQDQLANAPAFDKNRTDFTNSKWQQEVDHFFGVHTTARPAQR